MITEDQVRHVLGTQSDSDFAIAKTLVEAYAAQKGISLDAAWSEYFEAVGKPLAALEIRILGIDKPVDE